MGAPATPPLRALKRALASFVITALPLSLRQSGAAWIGRQPWIPGRHWRAARLVADLAERDPNAYHRFLWSHHLAYAESYEPSLQCGHKRIKPDRRLLFRDIRACLKRDFAAGTASPLHRTAVVIQRPLPYLYVARDVFADSGIAFEALDTLPLAAEPYAAAVDLVLEAISSDFTRPALIALLRSPHFRIASSPAIAATDFALAEARYLGGLDQLEGLAERWTTLEAPASREERRQQEAASTVSAVLVAICSSALARRAAERRSEGETRCARAPGGRRSARYLSSSAFSFARSRSTAFVWIWQTRDSVMPRIPPISFMFRSS